MKQRITITNNNKSFVTLSLEPWGEDYGMNPNDKFEIIADDIEETFYFGISFEEHIIFVYAEGGRSSYPRVFKDGVELPCGHNRRDQISKN